MPKYKKVMQSAYFNKGQPEGYTRSMCGLCNGTGTRGGSKCPTCAGYGAYYYAIEKEDNDG